MCETRVCVRHAYRCETRVCVRHAYNIACYTRASNTLKYNATHGNTLATFTPCPPSVWVCGVLPCVVWCGELCRKKYPCVGDFVAESCDVLQFVAVICSALQSCVLLRSLPPRGNAFVS